MSADKPVTEALAELANMRLDEETKKKAKEETGNLAIEATELVIDIATGQTAEAVVGAASAVGALFSAIASIFE
jgi:hypothetical protein